MSSDIPHLRRMSSQAAADICARVSRLAGMPYVIKREARAFADSRTPWDATRLANALDHVPREDRHFRAEIIDLIADIDRAAEECAGCVPTNRRCRVHTNV